MDDDGLAYVSPPLPLEHCLRQTQRVLQSVAFRNASTLQQLLQFLTSRALDNSPPELLKEYTIGVEGFGRPPDFDPKTDTIVRVQIHRLRQKLKEYYDSEGRHDLRIFLSRFPRGTIFRRSSHSPVRVLVLRSRRKQASPLTTHQKSKARTRPRSRTAVQALDRRAWG